MQNVINALLNFIAVSVWEELIWVGITLVLLGRFDLLDWRRWRRNIKLLAIPIIPVALTINILRYIILVPKPIMSISTLIMLILLITYITNKTDKIGKTKIYQVVLFTLVGAFIIAIIETLYIPFYLYLTNLKMSEINLNIKYNFIISIPLRIFQLGILIYIICSKTYKIKFNQFLYIFKNKLSIILTFIILIIIILVRIVSINLFSNEEFFVNISTDNKILFGTLLFILPTIFFMIMVISNLYYIHRNIQIEQKYSNMLEESELKER